MELSDNVLEEIRQSAARIEHGSIEIRLDKNNPFVDIIKMERIRIRHPRLDPDVPK
jgi:hypothetical protein